MNKFHFIALLLLIVKPAFGQYSTDLARLKAELEEIYTNDQKGRRDLSSYDPSSQEYKELWKTISKSDSANLNKVTYILDHYGWLSLEEVGRNGNSALFLVVQHADLATQIKYLPLLEEAVKTGKASASNFALLKDRVLVRLGKRQVYGSQIGRNNRTGLNYVLPIEDPENVDKRRAELGLTLMKEYLTIFNMNWSILQYESDIAASRTQDLSSPRPIFKPFKPFHHRDSL